MKIPIINSINVANKSNSDKRTVNNNKSTYVTNFGGLHGKSKTLLCLDIDGTFENKLEKLGDFFNLKKQIKGVLCFNTGRNLEKFYEKQRKLAQKGLILPTPKFLIARNGLYLYEKIGDQLVEHQGYSEKLTAHFDREKVLDVMNGIAFRPEYLMPGVKCAKPGDFNSSKLCQIEFWPSPRMVQFICDSSISDNILRTLKNRFKECDMDVRIIKQSFSKEECELTCTPEQMAVIRPRLNKDNYITQVDISAANKADGVDFLQKQINIPNNEVVMAGNDENDISMAKLTKDEERSFIGVKGRTKNLEKYMRDLVSKNNNLRNNLIFATQEGLEGIMEGINYLREKV